MARPPLTVTLITLNEEQNIANAIRSMSWAEEILVVDSGSTDRTVEIAKALGARVLYNAWPGYGQQKNFAQKMATHDWILNLDADEMVPAPLSEEIRNALEQADGTAGFYFPRKTFYLGRWIQHGGWYPNYLARLSHRKVSQWTEPNVHEELQINGKTKVFTHPLHHFAFSSIQDQILTNLRFSQLGSQDLKEGGQQPSMFLLLLKPIGKFIETYILKRGFLDGLPGFIISINAAHSMFLKYAYLCEAKIRKKSETQNV